MEIPGVCGICGAHGLVRTCTLCGRQACRLHHDPASGACVQCARRRGGPTTGPGPEPANLPEAPEEAGGRYT